jgi:hypothetical protein
MRGDLVFDGRNIYNATRVNAESLTYAGVGRPTMLSRTPASPSFAELSLVTHVDELCA